jgi:hypothetical protein
MPPKKIYPKNISPFSISVKNLHKDLTASGQLTPYTEKVVTHVTKLLSKPKLTSDEWRTAISSVDQAMKHGATDCGIGLVCSTELNQVAGASQKQLHTVITRYPILANAVRFCQAVRQLYFKLNSGALSKTQFQSQLGTLIQQNGELIAQSGYLQQWLGTQAGLCPEFDPADGWDWTDNNWFEQSNINLPNPWSGTTISLSNITRDTCSPDKGWVLYKRNLLNVDTCDPSKPLPTPSRLPKEQTLYFALYNTYMGILRVFVLIEDLSNGVRAYTQINCSTGVSSDVMYDKHGLFNYLSPICRTQADVPNITNNVLFFITSLNNWFVYDVPLSCDDSYLDHAPAIYLRTYIQEQKSDTLSLTGTYKGNGQIGPQSYFTNSNPGDGKDHQAGGGGTSLSSVADDFIKFGVPIAEIGASIASGNPIGIVIGATQLLESIIGIFDGSGSGGVQYFTTQGTLGLQGTIQESVHSALCNLALGSNYESDITLLPYYFKKNPNAILGLFNTYRPPIVNLHLDYQSHKQIRGGGHGGPRFITNYKLSVSVDSPDTINNLTFINNPNCSARLDKAQVQAVLQIPDSPLFKFPTDWMASGIICEESPAPYKQFMGIINIYLMNVFPNQFNDDGYYKQKILYFSPSTYFNDTSFNNVRNILYRVHYVFKDETRANLPPFEMFLTYQPQINVIKTLDGNPL